MSIVESLPIRKNPKITLSTVSLRSWFYSVFVCVKHIRIRLASCSMDAWFLVLVNAFVCIEWSSQQTMHWKSTKCNLSYAHNEILRLVVFLEFQNKHMHYNRKWHVWSMSFSLVLPHWKCVCIVHVWMYVHFYAFISFLCLQKQDQAVRLVSCR